MTEHSEIVRRHHVEQSLITHDVLARPIPLPSLDEPEVRPLEVWAAIRRNRWLILLCAVLGVGVAAYLTARATPMYQASSTLKLDVGQSSLPGILEVSSDDSELETEAEVLQSRTLAESTAVALALQFTLVEPLRVARETLFDSIAVAAAATPAMYRLSRQSDGRYAVHIDSTPAPAAHVRPGQRLELEGVAFRLLPDAAEYRTIGFNVQPLEKTALQILGKLSVTQVGRDVNILTIRYEDSDPGLVWRVPNAIADRYLARRRATAQAEARSTADFLREQLDTVGAQLAVAEDALREYRERYRAIDPLTEATSQMQRLVTMQSERATLESERVSLQQLLAQVDAKAAGRGPEDPTPYQELIAFPSLLRSQIAAGLLQSLSTVEQQRAELLARRTSNDPDVQVLNERIKELEGQLRSVVVTYLQGLGGQVANLDATLDRFGQQLGTLPQRELEVARLARKPKVLDEISALLERRLKEAEIAQAAGDPTVQVLDPASPPNAPFAPNRTTNLLGGLFCGLLLGGITSFLREYRDRTVHTRREIEVATGLPVIGLIPTIGDPRWSLKRIPLITETKKRRPQNGAIPPARERPAEPPAAVAGPPAPTRRTYTFLSGSDEAQERADAEPVPSGNGAAGAHVAPQAPAATAAPAAAAGESAPMPLPAALKSMELTRAGSAVAEAYGVLQTNIAFSFRDRSVRIVVVTSALPGEGKTTNAVNLALSLARRGLRVLLLDADLRRGSVHLAFEAHREPGLTEVLRSVLPFTHAIRSVDVEGQQMHYLSTGAAVPNPTSLLDSDAMRELLARHRDEYDIIVIDSPPANIVTDAALLGAMADGVIVVARVGVTEAGALGTAISHLRHVRAPVLGVVLNDIDFKRDAAYDASYRYYDYGQYTS